MGHRELLVARLYTDFGHAVQRDLSATPGRSELSAFTRAPRPPAPLNQVRSI